MSNLSLLIAATASQTAEEQRYRRHLRSLKQRPRPEVAVSTPVAVRRLTGRDRSELERLAAVDSATMPAGELLGADIDGVLVAAISLSDGSIVADPFRQSAAAVELLRLRATQLGQRGDGRRRRWYPRLRRHASRGRTRGTIGSSPPGGGGKLLRL